MNEEGTKQTKKDKGGRPQPYIFVNEINYVNVTYKPKYNVTYSNQI
jgi:hypothetical protein